MPKKKHEESSKEQSKRFLEEARKLVDAGELDITEAEKALDQVVRRAGPTRREKTK